MICIRDLTFNDIRNVKQYLSVFAATEFEVDVKFIARKLIDFKWIIRELRRGS